MSETDATLMDLTRALVQNVLTVQTYTLCHVPSFAHTDGYSATLLGLTILKHSNYCNVQYDTAVYITR